MGEWSSGASEEEESEGEEAAAAKREDKVGARYSAVPSSTRQLGIR